MAQGIKQRFNLFFSPTDCANGFHFSLSFMANKKTSGFTAARLKFAIIF